MRLLAGTRDLFFRFGQDDGLRLAQLLLERCPARDRHRAEVQIAAGQLAVSLGDRATAREVLAEASVLSAELGEPVLEAWTRFFQGLTETFAGETAGGREHLEASRALHRELGVRIGEGRATAVLGLGFMMEGDLAQAKELIESALSIYVAEEDRWGQGSARTFLGMITESTAPEPSSATAHYREAVDLLRPLRDATVLPVALVGQASVLRTREPADALRVAAAASAIRARVGGDFAPFVQAAHPRGRRCRARRRRRAGVGAGGAPHGG